MSSRSPRRRACPALLMASAVSFVGSSTAIAATANTPTTPKQGVATSPTKAATPSGAAPAKAAQPSVANGATTHAAPLNSATTSTPDNVEKLTVVGERSAIVTKSLNPKMTASLLNTPRSITVVTQEQMKLVNATSFEEAIRTVPGISFRGGDAYAVPGGNYPVIRGFGSYSNMYIDGMRDSGVSSREVFDVEDIEILKGPGSVYGGRGGLGGQINITTKKAKLGNFLTTQLGFGTADYKRGTLDINRQIGSHTAFRMNAMGDDANVAGRGPIGGYKWGVAPSLSFGLGTPTRLTLGYYHMYSSDLPDYSAPYSSTTHEPLAIPRSTVFALQNRDFEHSTTDMGQVILERDLWKSFVFRNTLQWTSTQYNFIATNPQWKSGSTDTILMEAKSGLFHTDNFQEQAMVSGKFKTSFIHHSVNFGIELSRERSTRSEYYVRDAQGNNLRNGGPCSVAYNCVSTGSLGAWSPYAPWNGSITIGEPGIPNLNTNLTTGSAYIFDTMSMLDDRVFINGGVRFDRFMNSTVQGDYGIANNQSFINYQAGIVYKPIRPVSLYFSYATASNPVGVNGVANGLGTVSSKNYNTAPENGQNVEVGAKADLLHEHLSVTGALFMGRLTNAQVSDGFGNTINAGTQRVRGAEINIAGSLTKKWDVFGGWTYLDSTITNGGPTGANVGKRFPYTPANSVTLWTTYRILPQFRVGGGLTFMSRRYVNAANTAWVPSYTRFDLVANYQITPSLDLQANLQNLTNKLYYDRIYTNYSRIAAGRTLTFQLTLHM